MLKRIVIASLLMLQCASNKGIVTSYYITSQENLNESLEDRKKNLECNCDQMIITDNEKHFLPLIMAFVDTTDFKFDVSISDSNVLSFDIEQKRSDCPNSEISGSVTENELKNGLDFSKIKKEVESRISSDEFKKMHNIDSQLWERLPHSKKDSISISKESTSIDTVEISRIYKIINFLKMMHNNFGVLSITYNDGINIGVKTNNRDYLWHWYPAHVSDCNPNEDFQKLWENWIIEDKEAHIKFKEYDKKDPYPYDVIDTEDSTVLKYRNKKDDITLKPCNLKMAHKMLDDIFKKQHVKISNETDMIEYHMGLGMWIRNNWGLWSGKSRLTPIFKQLGIEHPDNMSSFILDSYKQRKLLTNTTPTQASIDSFYNSLGDVDCQK